MPKTGSFKNTPMRMTSGSRKILSCKKLNWKQSAEFFRHPWRKAWKLVLVRGKLFKSRTQLSVFAAPVQEVPPGGGLHHVRSEFQCHLDAAKEQRPALLQRSGFVGRRLSRWIQKRGSASQ